MAEENVEVDDDINEIEAVIGIPKAPNKDTIVKVVTGEDVTIPSEDKEKLALKFQLVTTIALNILPDQQG